MPEALAAQSSLAYQAPQDCWGCHTPGTTPDLSVWSLGPWKCVEGLLCARHCAHGSEALLPPGVGLKVQSQVNPRAPPTTASCFHCHFAGRQMEALNR